MYCATESPTLCLVFLLACGGSPGSAKQPAADDATEHDRGHGQHRFEDADRWTEVFDAPDRAAWQKPDEVVALLALEPGMTVVDVGAGTGYFLSRLSNAVGSNGRVIATDIEPDMVRYMKERAEREKLGNVEVVLAPADDVGVASSTADRILVVDVWHHIADRERYAATLARVLRPGGAVFIVDFTLESMRGPPPAHRLAPEQVRAELEAAGLATELVSESLPDQYVVRARRR